MKNKLLLVLRVATIFIVVILLADVAIVTIPKLFNNNCYCVYSNSMYPALKKGDLIVTKLVEFDEINIGDILTFSSNRGGKVFTHRVVNIDKIDKSIYTKGDSNAEQDLVPSHYKTVVGRLYYTFSGLGYIGLLAQSPVGKWIIIATILLWLINWIQCKMKDLAGKKQLRARANKFSE